MILLEDMDFDHPGVELPGVITAFINTPHETIASRRRATADLWLDLNRWHRRRVMHIRPSIKEKSQLQSLYRRCLDGGATPKKFAEAVSYTIEYWQEFRGLQKGVSEIPTVADVCTNSAQWTAWAFSAISEE